MSFKAITTVYSYRHPETRGVINNLLQKGFPHRDFLRSTNPPGALDNFHEPVIERVLDFYQGDVPHMRDFGFRYPTAGSEEGIREVMTRLQTEGIRKIYILEGEYEGYKAVGETRGIETVEVSATTDPQSLAPGYWFISNPSAKDGNIIPNDFITAICEAGHQVFYDLAYLGSTEPYTFNLSHSNIFAAVISFSKTYGLFYDRIGFTFSRKPISSLYGNKWFKSIFALMIAEAIVSGLKPGEIYRKYRFVQEKIIADINRELGLGMRPSDAFLLGHLTVEDAAKLSREQLEMIAKFKRSQFYRFCLTPYFIESDQEAQQLLREGA